MQSEWQSVMDEIKNHISDMAFATYFQKIKFAEADEIIKIKVPNVFVKTQLEGKYHTAIVAALKEVGKKYKAIEISEGEREKTQKPAYPGNLLKSIQKKTQSKILSYGNKKRFATGESGLNPIYTFENYIVGSNNDLAVSAAHAIVDMPGTRYNPYFIYGGSGLGKTHLIQAIGNEMVKRYPDMKVLYVTIEQFYHDFVEAMRKKIDGFTQKYRKVDVLIVDDFQFIVGKEKSQDEFFHTFNELHQHNKQIIVSSDRLPNQIATVDERLSSRLMMGVPIDIQMPDFEVRSAILKSKAELLGVELDDKTVDYLATNIRSNVRDLEGKLNQLLALSELRGVSTSALIDDGYIEREQISMKRKNATPKQLLERIAKFYDLSSKDLIGKSRIKQINSARQVAMYLMNEELGMSTIKIGRIFDKDHTTIMHGVKVIKKDLKVNFTLREEINELRNKAYN